MREVGFEPANPKRKRDWISSVRTSCDPESAFSIYRGRPAGSITPHQAVPSDPEIIQQGSPTCIFRVLNEG
jgi:hypothetical protein